MHLLLIPRLAIKALRQNTAFLSYRLLEGGPVRLKLRPAVHCRFPRCPRRLRRLRRPRLPENPRNEVEALGRRS